MRGRRPEHLADVAGGRPAHERDRAARSTDAQELGGSPRLVRREHDAEHRRDGVEARVGKRERLGVALEKRDVEALHFGAEPSLFDETRNVVDSDDLASAACCSKRSVAAAGCDVEHAQSGVQVGGVAETLPDVHHPGREQGEVTARPHRLLPGLERLEVERRSCRVQLPFAFLLELARPFVRDTIRPFVLSCQAWKAARARPQCDAGEKTARAAGPPSSRPPPGWPPSKGSTGSLSGAWRSTSG